jgi:ribosomal protein L20
MRTAAARRSTAAGGEGAAARRRGRKEERRGVRVLWITGIDAGAAGEPAVTHARVIDRSPLGSASTGAGLA